jgi:hypothetical protein
MMRDTISADLFARSIESLLAFADTEDLCVQRFAFSFAPHSLKQGPCVWNKRNTSQFPILRTCFCVTAHNDLVSVKVHISPSDFAGLSESATCECQACREVGAVGGVAAVARSHFVNQRVEFVDSRKSHRLRLRRSERVEGVLLWCYSWSATQFLAYIHAHFLQSVCVILRISVSFSPGQLLMSAARRCSQ